MEENKNVETASTELNEGSNIGWGVLGFFFPIVGLILFLVWKNNRKAASKVSGIGALIGFVVQIICIILFSLLSFGTLIGISSVIEKSENNPTENETKTNTVEKNTKTTDKEETNTTKEEVDTNDSCVVKATKEGDILYSYKYAESCDVTKVVDEDNKLLFKAKNDNKELTLNGSIITNNNVELNNTNEEFWKLDDSIVFYSNLCSPGYCYIYVYNTKDNTGFKIEPSIENDIVVPYINGMDSFREKNLVVKFKSNESSGLEGDNDPKVVLFKKIRSCEITDIDAALASYGLNDFAFQKTYNYPNVNGSIKNDPTITVAKTIKGYYNERITTCNR